MSIDFDEDDPNAPSKNQVKLKRLERSIRQRCQPEVFMMLDGISILKDQQKIHQALIALQQKLAS